jgi:hypothetical protein
MVEDKNGMNRRRRHLKRNTGLTRNKNIRKKMKILRVVTIVTLAIHVQTTVQPLNYLFYRILQPQKSGWSNCQLPCWYTRSVFSFFKIWISLFLPLKSKNPIIQYRKFQSKFLKRLRCPVPTKIHGHRSSDCCAGDADYRSHPEETTILSGECTTPSCLEKTALSSAA